MKSASIDAVEILRLHTDHDGCVWYGDDSQLAVNSYLEPSDFVTSDAFGVDLGHVKAVRILGTKANAPLIVQLQQWRASHPEEIRKQRVQLCSPAIVATEALRLHPEAVLQQLWQPTYSSALHGLWHDMTNMDYCSYAMMTQMSQDSPVVPETVRRIAAYHPAWRALSFVASMDVDAACRLICEVVDPRWYRHPFHPHRPSKLFAYLGLTPQNMLALCSRSDPSHNYGRAALAVRTWFNANLVGDFVDTPENFLWKIYVSAGDQAKGMLRATRRLISLLISVWMYAVAPPHPEVGFSAMSFFRDESMAAAFEYHSAQKR